MDNVAFLAGKCRGMIEAMKILGFPEEKAEELEKRLSEILFSSEKTRQKEESLLFLYDKMNFYILCFKEGKLKEVLQKERRDFEDIEGVPF